MFDYFLQKPLSSFWVKSTKCLWYSKSLTIDRITWSSISSTGILLYCQQNAKCLFCRWDLQSVHFFLFFSLYGSNLRLLCLIFVPINRRQIVWKESSTYNNNKRTINWKEIVIWFIRFSTFFVLLPLKGAQHLFNSSLRISNII